MKRLKLGLRTKDAVQLPRQADGKPGQLVSILACDLRYIKLVIVKGLNFAAFTRLG